MDIAGLASEMDADPLGRGCDETLDAEAADGPNARDRPGRRPVPPPDPWPGLQAPAASGAAPVQRGTAVTTIRPPTPNGIDLATRRCAARSAPILVWLRPWSTPTPWASPPRAPLMAPGDDTVSRAAEPDLGPVPHPDAARARRG